MNYQQENPMNEQQIQQMLALKIFGGMEVEKSLETKKDRITKAIWFKERAHPFIKASYKKTLVKRDFLEHVIQIGILENIGVESYILEGDGNTTRTIGTPHKGDHRLNWLYTKERNKYDKVVREISTKKMIGKFYDSIGPLTIYTAYFIKGKLANDKPMIELTDLKDGTYVYRELIKNKLHMESELMFDAPPGKFEKNVDAIRNFRVYLVPKKEYEFFNEAVKYAPLSVKHKFPKKYHEQINLNRLYEPTEEQKKLRKEQIKKVAEEKKFMNENKPDEAEEARKAKILEELSNELERRNKYEETEGIKKVPEKKRGEISGEVVTLEELADEIGRDETHIRKRLKKKGFKKPDGQWWIWPKDHPDLPAIYKLFGIVK